MLTCLAAMTGDQMDWWLIGGVVVALASDHLDPGRDAKICQSGSDEATSGDEPKRRYSPPVISLKTLQPPINFVIERDRASPDLASPRLNPQLPDENNTE